MSSSNPREMMRDLTKKLEAAQAKHDALMKVDEEARDEDAIKNAKSECQFYVQEIHDYRHNSTMFLQQYEAEHPSTIMENCFAEGVGLRDIVPDYILENFLFGKGNAPNLTPAGIGNHTTDKPVPFADHDHLKTMAEANAVWYKQAAKADEKYLMSNKCDDRVAFSEFLTNETSIAFLQCFLWMSASGEGIEQFTYYYLFCFALSVMIYIDNEIRALEDAFEGNEYILKSISWTRAKGNLITALVAFLTEVVLVGPYQSYPARVAHKKILSDTYQLKVSVNGRSFTDPKWVMIVNPLMKVAKSLFGESFDYERVINKQSMANAMKTGKERVNNSCIFGLQYVLDTISTKGKDGDYQFLSGLYFPLLQVMQIICPKYSPNADYLYSIPQGEKEPKETPRHLTEVEEKDFHDPNITAKVNDGSLTIRILPLYKPKEANPAPAPSTPPRSKRKQPAKTANNSSSSKPKRY